MKPISRDEDRLWEEHLYREEPDADFTLKVMQKLDDVSMERDEAESPWSRKVPKTRWIYRTGIVAAAVLLFGGGALLAWDRTGAPEQPVVSAVNIPRLPDIPVPTEIREAFLTEDYKRLKPPGLVVNPNIQIEDQGYTFEIKDVLVDRSQIVFLTEQTSPDDIRIPVVTPEAGKIHITDVHGNLVAVPVVNSQPSGINYRKFVFQLNDVIPDQIVVRGELNFLKIPDYYDAGTNTTVKNNTTVDWSFQFNIDMTKAKAMATMTPMNNTYTTPEGLKLDMTQLVRTPSGTRLDVNVSLNDQLQAKVSEDWKEQMDILYHIEIPETNEYRIFNGSRPYARQAKFRLRDLSEANENGGWLKLSETWDPAFVTVDAKNTRFVLDGYTLPVKEEKSIEIDLEQLPLTTTIFEQSGDRVVLNGYNFDPERGSYIPSGSGTDDQHPLVLLGSAEFSNEIAGDKWVAVDREGIEYPVSILNSIKEINNDEKYVTSDLKLMVHGLHQNSATKFTLKRTVVHREFRDVNWEVDLPSYDSLPWLK
ncbi:DUF4179 domain-containing protein [Paenibacillus sp. FSL R7-0026]|uniref:DUF4179 domain-containing protein n=1 Tax=Paenibacillus sp. FSL R7-0026 TaxID=2921668 RepID=UPI0030F9355E